MNNTHKQENPLVKFYLQELKLKLDKLPRNEKEDQINEIKQHLNMQINEHLKNGIDINQATKKTLDNFLSPTELADEILKNSQNHNFNNKSESLFQIGLIATIGSLGGLSIPIIKGIDLNISLIIPFLLAMIIGILLLKSSYIEWNNIKLKNVKIVSRILIAFSGVPLTFFALRIIKENQINNIIMIYTAIILIIILSLYGFLKNLYTKHL
ncbi:MULTISPECIES: HAAS signaling domain-containing protein [Bacillus cereus group]|uniref:HAAS signaling domain-containing protein n=2 Tax=Bacillus TaxID=1386 RepID=UPI000CD9E3B8|nr:MULTISPECIES: hypothetical protein [Bacillus cereus group]UOB98930.1 hypothetical protein BTI679_63310 [Bacillus wiedmannii]